MDKNTPIPKEVLALYVVDPEGKVYQQVPDPKNAQKIYLRRGNRYQKIAKNVLAQDLAEGTWRHPDEKTARAFIIKDNQIIAHISQLIVKRTILSQLVIEVDDELKLHFEGDKLAVDLIRRSQNYLEKRNTQMYEQLYGQDERALQNYTKAIDRLLSTLSKKSIGALNLVSGLIERADKDQSLYSERIKMQGKPSLIIEK